MRFLSFVADRTPRFGALVENRVVDLGARMSEYASLRDVLAAGALTRAQDIAAETSADFELKQITFAPPVTQPGRIIAVDGNFLRAAEVADPDAGPRYPQLCLRTVESLVGHRQPLVRPLESLQLDYAGALALVIGRRGRRVPPAEAYRHVAGFTLANDGAVRDWPARGMATLTEGRNFPQSGSIGPFLVTLDEIVDPAELTLETRVNGEVRQHETLARLRFPLPELVSHVSTFMTLEPGDVIITGTPAGIGADQDPPVYLSEGDKVEVEVNGIGTLANEVSQESADKEEK